MKKANNLINIKNKFLKWKQFKKIIQFYNKIQKK